MDEDEGVFEALIHVHISFDKRIITHMQYRYYDYGFCKKIKNK